MNINITETDGQFIDLTEKSEFTPYNGGSITRGAAVKIQDQGYFSDPVLTINAYVASPYVWDEASSTWSTANNLHTNDADFDYYGYNLFIMDLTEGSSDKIAYFCKDDQIINLPAYNGAYTRFRLNSHVKKGNFATFQTMANSHTSYHVLPLAVLTRMDGSSRRFDYVGLLRNKDTGEIYMGTSSGTPDWFSIATPNNKKISVARYTFYKDTTIPDIEERLHNLENQMINLNNKVSKLENEVNTLAQNTTGIISAVSKFYVSR